MNSANVTGVSPLFDCQLIGYSSDISSIVKGRPLQAYRNFAVHNPVAIPRGARASSTIVPPVITRSSTIVVKAAIRPAPNTPLPVRTHGKIARLAALELEARNRWRFPGLRGDAWVDGFLAEICDAQRPGIVIVVTSLAEKIGRVPFHMMQCSCRLEEAQEQDLAD